MLWPIIAALTAACIESGFDPIDDDSPPPRVVVEDEFTQAPLPAVDILFVVDDTGSMAQEQASLAEHFVSLAGALREAGIGWQAGVVTTDMTRADAGWLQGVPWVITPDLDQVEQRFADAVQVGVDGVAPEAGLAAAIHALDLSEPGGPNAGFRRPDALLHVIFVSDADDESDEWLDGDPVSVFLDAMAAEQERTGQPATASAVVGDIPRGCTSVNGDARPGLRYHLVVDGTGGETASICAADFSDILESLADVAIVYLTRFDLRTEPEPESVRVAVDGVRVDAGWTLETSPPAVVFDEAPAPGVRITVTYVVKVDT